MPRFLLSSSEIQVFLVVLRATYLLNPHRLMLQAEVFIARTALPPA